MLPPPSMEVYSIRILCPKRPFGDFRIPQGIRLIISFYRCIILAFHLTDCLFGLIGCLAQLLT